MCSSHLHLKVRHLYSSTLPRLSQPSFPVISLSKNNSPGLLNDFQSSSLDVDCILFFFQENPQCLNNVEVDPLWRSIQSTLFPCFTVQVCFYTTGSAVWDDCHAEK